MSKHIEPKEGYPEPWRWPKTITAHVLGLTPSGLMKLVEKDPTFPRPMKDGQHPSSKTYFIVKEVKAWMGEKARQRDQQAA